MFDPPSDCLRCGACCHSPSRRFVRVTGADWTRLGDAAERLAHFTGRGNEAYMKMTAGHCAALEVRVDAHQQPEYFCTIYDRRPQICRDLARGSPECAGERDNYRHIQRPTSNVERSTEATTKCATASLNVES